MKYNQTSEALEATIFPTFPVAREVGSDAATKYQMHFMVRSAQSPNNGFVVRFANGQYLKADK